MTIQHPIYLWAFLGLLVPLVIHLWNRKAGKTIKVGSVQWLIASENTRFSSIRFNEVGLYIIRSLLVVVAILILLDLSYTQTKEPIANDKQWILAEKPLLRHPDTRTQIDSLVQQGHPLHLLQAGLPLLESSAIQKIKVKHRHSELATSSLNYWSFLRELNDRPDAPEKVTLFTYNTQQRFVGKRPTLSFRVQWLNLPQKRKQVFLVDALQLPQDSLQISIGMSDEQGTTVIRKKIKTQTNTKIKDLPSIIVKEQEVSFAQATNESITIRHPRPQKIQIWYDKNFSLDQQYFKAALEAVGEYLHVKIEVNSKSSTQGKNLDKPKADWLVAFTQKSAVRNIAKQFKGKRILYEAQPTSQWLSKDSTRQNAYFLHQRVNPQINPAALTSDFLENLTQTLFANPKATERIQRFDQRRLSQSQAMPQTIVKKTTATHPTTQTQGYHFILWLVLVIGVLTERIVQETRNK